MHHGRKGQKWGHKNGPPYPLDYNKLSAEEKEQAKSDAIRRGDVREAKYNREHFTDQELQAVINRYNLNAKLSELAYEPTKFDKFIAVSNKMGKAAEAVGKGVNLYNHLAKISNAVTGSDLPIVGEKKGDGEGKKKDNNNSNNNSGGNNKKGDNKAPIKKTERNYENGKLVEEKEFKKNGSSTEKTWDTEGNLTKLTTNKVDRNGNMEITRKKFDDDYNNNLKAEKEKSSQAFSNTIDNIGKLLGADTYARTTNTKVSDISPAQQEALNKNMEAFIERDRKKQNSFHFFDTH